MRKILFLISICLIICLSLGLVFAAAGEVQYISIAANPIGGSSYRMGAMIADVVNRTYPDKVDVVCEETNGYMENVTLVSDGECEVGFSNNMLVENAFHAKELFEGYTKGKVNAVLNMSPVMFNIVVRADSPIESIRDIKGKKVGMGQPGGSSLVDARNLMKVIGLVPGEDFIAYDVTGKEQKDMFMDERLDVFIWNGKLVNSSVAEMASQRDIRLIALEDDIYEGMTGISEGYGRYTIPAGTYANQDEDIITVGCNTVLTANADVPEEAIYYFVKGFIDNLDELKERDKGFKKTIFENLLDGITIPLHPGVLRYFEEAKVPGLEEFKEKYQQIEPNP